MSPDTLRKFFPRRFARIYPALLVFSTIASLGAAYFDDQISVGSYVSAITLTYNYYSVYVGHAGVLDHVWSLSIEEHLYILLGFMAFVYRRQPYPVASVLFGLALLFCVNGAAQTISGLDYYAVYWRSDVRGASILFGAAAFLWLKDRSASPWMPIALGLIGFVLQHGRFPDPLKYSIGSAALAASVALLPNSKGVIRKLLETVPLRRAGTLSYSVYLWQQPFFLMTVLGIVPAPIAVLVAVICGVLSFRFVEQPARDYLNQRFGTGRRIALADSAVSLL